MKTTSFIIILLYIAFSNVYAKTESFKKDKLKIEATKTVSKDTSIPMNALRLKAGKMEIEFTKDGLLRNIRLATPTGWRTTAAAGSFVSKRRTGDWYIQYDGKAAWLKPAEVLKKGEVLVLNCFGEEIDLMVEWKSVFEDGFLITCHLKAKKDLKTVSVGMEAFNLPSVKLKSIYCLPYSLPVIRDEKENKIPGGFINNGTTLNNTFSLNTSDETFSLSVITPEIRRKISRDSAAVMDYLVGFKPGIAKDALPQPNEGSIFLIANNDSPIHKGESITRQFLLSASSNIEGVYTTGNHIGQYMALVKQPHSANLLELYQKSVSYLLDNTSNFVNDHRSGKGYWGAIHSKTGDGFGNGRAFYAMYGNSFSTAALSQYAVINKLSPRDLERLEEGPLRILTTTPVLTKEGAYWSMWDMDSLRVVDQAYRPWLETHATGWIAYYLLESFQIGDDKRLLAIAEKNLAWLAFVQNADGSFPKYFENGKPSKELQGDLAWNALAFFKANELKIIKPGEDYLKKGIAAVEWLIANPVHTKRYYGAFEDVGGVTESYTSSVSAHALMAAYRATGNKRYLDAAKAALSVSLAWITNDFGPMGQAENSWNVAKAIQPIYGQIESVSCYYPCSYTLPMMYLAATEVAVATQSKERNNWLQIARNFNHMDAFLSDIPGTKARFGMEWLTVPFLVFSEWGNGQTCWAILETLKNRLNISFPEINVTSDFKTNISGDDVSLVISSFEEPLCKVAPEVDYMVFSNSTKDKAYLALLDEGSAKVQTIKINQNFLASMGNESKLSLFNVAEQKEIGIYSKEELTKGIEILVDEAVLIELK